MSQLCKSFQYAYWSKKFANSMHPQRSIPKEDTMDSRRVFYYPWRYQHVAISLQMEAIVFIILRNFFATLVVLLIGEYHSVHSDIPQF